VAAPLFAHVVPKVVQDSLSKHPYSFSAAQRIPRSEGYGLCLKSTMLSDKHFKIFFIPNQFKKARLGIVVAKRNVPKSVDRNLTKRKIRALFRIHQIKECGIDIVVMTRNGEHLDNFVDTLSKLFSRVATRCAES
jgi:ribonuclease P protein component